VVVPAGEQHKTQSTVDKVIQEFISLEVDRSYTIVGVGGGVITDLTGYIASVYMRGLRFGFVPTSILAIVDASIGGKNGIDVDGYKNLVGTISQPEFILHDLSFLNSLPEEHWKNGFAEIIKHACILDKNLFAQLKENNIAYYQNDKDALAALIYTNVTLKAQVVLNDEFEKGDRRLLNYGHTFGHAIENTYNLIHGKAISVGMMFANFLAAKTNSFAESTAVADLLQQYQLPVQQNFEAALIWKYFQMDKKRKGSVMYFIVLEHIGKGIVQAIALTELEQLLYAYEKEQGAF
jgi:3-dehydroquinate synthase